MTETNPVRILVTGTRENFHRIREEVYHRLDALVVHPTFPLHRPIIVVHGKCPNGGVDLYAAQWAQHWGHGVDPHPADWQRYGRQAGPIRNTEMINTQPDYCLGFPGPGSSGTWDCLKKAMDARIPTQVWPVGVWLEPEALM